MCLTEEIRQKIKQEEIPGADTIRNIGMISQFALFSLAL